MDLSRPSADAPARTQADARSQASTAGRPSPWIATLAFAAVALGRGLSGALPGARSGIETWIHASNLVSATVTQLAAILAATETALLLVTTLWQRQLGHAYRLVVMPAGAALVTLIALSIRQRLESELLVVLALSAAVLAISAAGQLLLLASTRAAGLVIGASAAAGLCYAAARHGALAEPGLVYTEVPPDWLRPMATAGLLLDVAATGIAVLWLARGTHRKTAVLCFGGAAVVAGLTAWAAAGGTEPDAGLGSIVASRFLSALTPHPAPFAPELLRGSFEVFALLAAIVFVWTPGRLQPLRVALALVLMARASLDIPLCALLLGLGSLAGPLFASPPSALPSGPPVDKLSAGKEHVQT